LPTAKDLSSALDEDADGAPGITLFAKVVLCQKKREMAYVALRTSAALNGTIESADAYGGTLDLSLDQSVLGYTDPCLGAAADLVVKVNPGSTFRARRVGKERDVDGNGNVTCGELVVAAPDLFGNAWSDSSTR
jgi:hypothetical protein